MDVCLFKLWKFSKYVLPRIRKKMAIMIMLHRLNIVFSECVISTATAISIFVAATFKHHTANQYRVHSLSSDMPN